MSVSGPLEWQIASSSMSRQSAAYSNEWKPGETAHFEYHCHRGHDSDDADLWYRSHQPVTVLQRHETDLDPYLRGEKQWDSGEYGGPMPKTPTQRLDYGLPFAYQVQFPDGLQKTVMEDEMYTHPRYFDPQGGPPPLNEIRQYEPGFQSYQPPRQAHILDEIHSTLPPEVWDNPGDKEPVLKPGLADFIRSLIYSQLESNGYHDPASWLNLVITGSLTTYQYGPESDCDVSLFINSSVLPEWSRAEMIGIMVSNCDGHNLPGTHYPLQCFVVSKALHPGDLYRPGLRSGYDIDTGHWLEPPDPHRSRNVEQSENGFYTYALEVADKMDRLLRYEPTKAVQFFNSIRRRRRADQALGKGDYSESNIVYKFLEKRGLTPKLESISPSWVPHAQFRSQGLRTASAWHEASHHTATIHDIIYKHEARGNSRPVSFDEFQQLAEEGRNRYQGMLQNQQSTEGLDRNWDAIKRRAYEETLKPWGGQTIDPVMGEPIPDGADEYAMTSRPPGTQPVRIPENSSWEQFEAAMEEARQRFAPHLQREGHHLGVFHDDDLKSIDFDPTIVVNNPRDVETIGAYTRNVGGAYHFATGNGYWPPHVAEDAQAPQPMQTTPSPTGSNVTAGWAAQDEPVPSQPPSDIGQWQAWLNAQNQQERAQQETLRPSPRIQQDVHPSTTAALQHTGQIPGDEQLSGGVEVTGPNPFAGVNHSFVGNTNAGHQVYIKPQGEFHRNDLANERATFAAAHGLGIPMPHTVVRHVELTPQMTEEANAHMNALYLERGEFEAPPQLEPGSYPMQVQHSVGGQTALAHYGRGGMQTWFQMMQDHPQQFRNIAMLDNVIGNEDRHLGNAVVGDDGQLYPIDHGGAFQLGNYKLQPYGFNKILAGQPLREDEIARLRSMLDHPYEDAGIDPHEAESARMRTLEMIESGKFLGRQPQARPGLGP